MQTLDGINARLLERDPVDAEDLGGARVVVAVDTLRGQVAAGGDLDGGRVGELAGEVREAVADDLGDLLVAVAAGRREEALAPRLGPLHGLDVGEGHVPDVDPQVHAARRDLGRPLALDQVDVARVARVDAGEGVEVVGDGAEDEGRADGGDVEVGLLARDEVPGGLLGLLLGDPVRGRGRARQPVLVRARVPVGLAEDLGRVGEARLRDEGGEGARDDDALDAGGVLLDGAQHRVGAVDGRVQQLRLGVGPLEVERRGGVLNVIKPGRRGDHVVEGPQDRDVRHDGHRQLRPRVLGPDLRRLGLGPHRRHHFVAPLEEELEDVGWKR